MVNSRIKKNRSIRRPRNNTQEHKKLIKGDNKGRRPPEHFKHHLELCPGNIRPPSPASPPLPPFLCHIFSPPFPFPALFSQSCFCVRPLICTLALSFCTCPTVGCLLSRRLPEAGPLPSGDVQRRRRGEERTSSPLMQCWHSALADGTIAAEGEQQQPPHTTEKPYSLTYSHSDALAS